MRDKGSFRDPSGYVFKVDGKIYRAISSTYKNHFEHASKKLIFEELFDKGFLIRHKAIDKSIFKDLNDDIYKVIQPETIQFISYPYEWSFSQLKDAAILTLELQLELLKNDFTLKDATPYNIQFLNNKPIFIDTLSIEKINSIDYTWKAFKQFSEMFYMPLLLMSNVDLLSIRFLETFINGINYDLFFKLISFKQRLNPRVFLNLYLPYLIQKKLNKRSSIKNQKVLPKKNAEFLIVNLISSIKNIKIKSSETEWAEYYEEVNEEKPSYLVNKKNIVESYVKNLKVDKIIAWDIGANDGEFSKLISKIKNSKIYSIDIDPLAVEKNYLKNKEIENIFPLRIDFTSPSASIGWMTKERSSIFNRLEKPNLILGLAIMHHFINSNIPLYEILELFSLTNQFLLIEYIPINDIKARQIFSSRGEDFNYPSKVEFEKTFKNQFLIIESKKLEPTDRILYLMKRNEN